MPPWPSLSRLVRQRMFLFAATLHVVGAPSTFTRNVPSGPPACGQPATVTGAPVSGTALSPTLTSAASFSAVTLTTRSEEHTSELQSHSDLVCRLLLEKKKKKNQRAARY